jgi:hypothetical protein
MRVRLETNAKFHHIVYISGLGIFVVVRFGLGTLTTNYLFYFFLCHSVITNLKTIVKKMDCPVCIIVLL